MIDLYRKALKELKIVVPPEIGSPEYKRVMILMNIIKNRTNASGT